MLRVLTQLAFFTLAATTLPAPAADVRYAVQQTEFAVRAGKSYQERALINIKSGEAVTLLEADSQAGWTKVRTADGTEGWIQNKYLAESPAPGNERVSPRLEALKARHEQMESELAKLRDACANTTPSAAVTAPPAPTAKPELPAVAAAVAPSPVPTALPPTTMPDPIANTEEEDSAEAVVDERLNLDRLRREWILTGAAISLLTTVVVVRLLGRTP